MITRTSERNSIELYRGGYARVCRSAAQDQPEELDSTRAGKWSVREIIHHLADSEMTAAVRLRLLIAEDRPTIHGYDQDEFARRLYYDRPHEASLELFRVARQSTAEILDRLTPAEWVREGMHTEAGPYGVEAWLKTYADTPTSTRGRSSWRRDAASQTSGP